MALGRHLLQHSSLPRQSSLRAAPLVAQRRVCARSRTTVVKTRASAAPLPSPRLLRAIIKGVLWGPNAGAADEE